VKLLTRIGASKIRWINAVEHRYLPFGFAAAGVCCVVSLNSGWDVLPVLVAVLNGHLLPAGDVLLPSLILTTIELIVLNVEWRDREELSRPRLRQDYALRSTAA
jgi:hypothetical protein